MIILGWLSQGCEVDLKYRSGTPESDEPLPWTFPPSIDALILRSFILLFPKAIYKSFIELRKPYSVLLVVVNVFLLKQGFYWF